MLLLPPLRRKRLLSLPKPKRKKSTMLKSRRKPKKRRLPTTRLKLSQRLRSKLRPRKPKKLIETTRKLSPKSSTVRRPLRLPRLKLMRSPRK